MRGHSTGHLSSIPQDCQGHEKQVKTEKLSHIREGREISQLNAMWLPGLDLGKEDINGKADEIQIKPGVNSKIYIYILFK